MKLTTTDQGNRAVRSMMAVALTVMLIALLGSGTSVVAGDQQDFDFVLQAGEACGAFAVHFEGSGSKQVVREFRDGNGNLVRTLSAGTGSDVTITNLSTGATLSLRSNGAVSQITENPDGSQTVTRMGHNVLILFPTDVPAGPSTTLYVGRFVYTIDINQVFTLEEVSGQTTDICAALS